MDLKALKVGDMFLTLETSAKDNLRLGVFHAIEYVLATEGEFLVIEIPQDGDATDIDNGRGYYGLYSDDWRPRRYTLDEYLAIHQKSEGIEERLLLRAPTTFEYLKNDIPRSVNFLLYAALNGITPPKP